MRIPGAALLLPVVIAAAGCSGASPTLSGGAPSLPSTNGADQGTSAAPSVQAVPTTAPPAAVRAWATATLVLGAHSRLLGPTTVAELSGHPSAFVCGAAVPPADLNRVSQWNWLIEPTGGNTLSVAAVLTTYGAGGGTAAMHAAHAAAAACPQIDDAVAISGLGARGFAFSELVDSRDPGATSAPTRNLHAFVFEPDTLVSVIVRGGTATSRKASLEEMAQRLPTS